MANLPGLKKHLQYWEYYQIEESTNSTDISIIGINGLITSTIIIVVQSYGYTLNSIGVTSKGQPRALFTVKL